MQIGVTNCGPRYSLAPLILLRLARSRILTRLSGSYRYLAISRSRCGVRLPPRSELRLWSTVVQGTDFIADLVSQSSNRRLN